MTEDADRDLAEAKEVVTATARRLQARLEEAEARLRALEERERALERRERELEKREGTSAKRQARAQEPRAQAPPPEQAEPPPAPVLEETAVVPVGDGRFNVLRLEALVERAAAAQPDRAEEWRSYVFFLRGHADTDGNLPPSFHHLVEEVFGELL